MIFVLHLYYFLPAQQPGDPVNNEPIIIGEEDPVNEPINNEPIISINLLSLMMKLSSLKKIQLTMDLLLLMNLSIMNLLSY